MEKLYLGLHLHKRTCWVSVPDAEGRPLESRQLGTEKWGLLPAASNLLVETESEFLPAL